MTGHCLAGTLLAVLAAPSLQAETLTVDNGTGIVWEGLPFNVSQYTKQGPFLNVNPTGSGIISKGRRDGYCNSESPYDKNGISLGGGIWITPRDTGFAKFQRDNLTY